MADITGGVKITGFISPTDSLDTYAVIDPVYGIDGLRNVTGTSEMYSITSSRRRQGMIVGIKNGQSADYYSLLKSSGWANDATDWAKIEMVTGFTFNNANYDLTLNTLNSSGITRSLSILASDMTVTGGTYNPLNGSVTFTTNSGGTFIVTGFTVGYTNIYTSAATYNQSSAEILLDFTDPSKNLTITGVTSLYGGNDSLKSDRVVNLSGKTLNFSSSTQANSLTINNSGQVGIGVSSASTALHISAATNPIKVEGFTNVSGRTTVIGIDSSNQLQKFTGNTNSVPYFLNGSMVTSPWITFVSGTTHTLNLATSDTAYGAELNFGASRASLNFPANFLGNLTIKVGATNPFDASKGIVLQNGTTKKYLEFDSINDVVAGSAFRSAHTATFGATLIINPSVDTLGTATEFWGTSGIVTRAVANTYIDTSTAATANEIVGSSFDIPTFRSHSAKGYSAMTNVYIAGAPTVGTNASANNTYALKVKTGTTYLGGSLVLSGVSSGTTTNVLNLESDGTVSYRSSSDLGFVAGSSTLYWYDENNTPPTTSPIASGAGSIALGNGAEALDQGMFVFGDNAGKDSIDTQESIFMGLEAGYVATGASGSIFIGRRAGYIATDSSASNFIGNGAGQSASGLTDSNFIGTNAGINATGATSSNFIGVDAGNNATDSSESNFIGAGAGFGAVGATNSNFIGWVAGDTATGATNSNFIGFEAGYKATGATNSNFIGGGAGSYAKLSIGSNFIGNSAGYNASNSSGSNFIGQSAGYQVTGSNYSTMIGYKAGYQPISPSAIGTNNIIIGTNISLSSGTNNSINIGGVLFGTDTYGNVSNLVPLSTPANGKIGINVIPQNITNALHVSASTNPVRIDNLTNTSGSTKVIGIDSSNQLVKFTGNTTSVPYFLNGDMVTNEYLTFASGSTSSLNIGGVSNFGSLINLGAGRATISYPNVIGGELSIKIGNTTPFDSSKTMAFRNGGTKIYLKFITEAGTPPAGMAYYCAHTATFGATLIVSPNFDGLGYGQGFWGTSGIVTRTVASTYVDTTTATTGSEIVGSSFGVPTFSSYTGKTYSAMTNVYIAGAPIVGTSASTLSSYALKVQTGTTYFGDNVTLSGISTGTTSQLLTRESTGNVSFRNLGDVGVISSGNTTLYWYNENSTPPTNRPLASGSGSIAFGNTAKALASNMFVFGISAGTSATNATSSMFFGDRTGYGATNANNSLFMGDQAGYQASSASDSVFIGNGAGSNASAANNSAFIGQNAGLGGSNANNSIMIGGLAGYGATNASNSQFFGASAGRGATGTTYSFFAGSGAGWSANTVTSSTFIGRNAGSGATNASYSMFVGEDAGKGAALATTSTFVGYKAGENSSSAQSSIFIGQYAGQSAVTDNGNIIMLGHQAGQTTNNLTNSVGMGYQAVNSAVNGRGGVFIGYQAGQDSIYLSSSVVIGASAGKSATGVTNSNSVFIGNGAGQSANRAVDAVFIGNGAGYQASQLTSIFIGGQSGYQATGSTNSVFIGNDAGNNAKTSTSSVFIGTQAGYQATGVSATVAIGNIAGQNADGANAAIFIGTNSGKDSTGVTNSICVGSNTGSGSTASRNIIIGNKAGSSGGFGNTNIIIGQNVTLSSGTANSFNIGGVLFGTGTNSDDVSAAVYTAITGSSVSIGINKGHDSAILDLTSTSKGFLPPRLTASQASSISSPAEGLMIYVTSTSGTFTSKGWWGWDGSTWKQLG